MYLINYCTQSAHVFLYAHIPISIKHVAFILCMSHHRCFRIWTLSCIGIQFFIILIISLSYFLTTTTKEYIGGIKMLISYVRNNNVKSTLSVAVNNCGTAALQLVPMPAASEIERMLHLVNVPRRCMRQPQCGCLIGRARYLAAAWGLIRKTGWLKREHALAIHWFWSVTWAAGWNHGPCIEVTLSNST